MCSEIARCFIKSSSGHEAFLQSKLFVRMVELMFIFSNRMATNRIITISIIAILVILIIAVIYSKFK